MEAVGAPTHLGRQPVAQELVGAPMLGAQTKPLRHSLATRWVGAPETSISIFLHLCVVFVSKSIFSREKVCREREVGREIKFYYRKFRKFIVLVINPLLKYPIKIQNLNSIKFKFFNFINIKVLVCEKDSIFLKC